MASPGDFRLHDVTVRPHACELARGGTGRRVDYKAMQVLLRLCDGAGETVTKQQLLAQVWAGAAVTDDVLTGAISMLRKALGDDARAPRFIQTIPREGYRLVAPVTEAPPLATAGHETTRQETARHGTARHRGRLVLALLLTLSLTAAALWFQRTPPTPTASAVPEVEALAVLPLANLTGDPEQSHLADGMTEALIGELARAPELRIISRTSVMRFRDTDRSLPEIGRELGVDALIEGSVQRQGNRLRIHAQLVLAAEDRPLWSDTFDGDITTVLALQRQVAIAISGRIRRALGPREAPPLVPVAADAYDAYLRGRYLAARGNLHDVRRAIGAFEQATAAEPEFANAHTALAEAWALLGEEGAVPPREAFAKARAASTAALALAPDDARALAVEAIIDFAFDWRFDDAEATFRRAIALDPSQVRARQGYARLLTLLGRTDEAIEQARRVRELDPLAYSRPRMATILSVARRPDLALAEIDTQLEVEPGAPYLHLQRALLLRQLGTLDQALDAYQTALRLEGAPQGELDAVARAFAENGAEGVYRLILAEIEHGGRRAGPMGRAEALIGSGFVDRGLAALEEAFDERHPQLLRIATDPTYDAVRGHPRFRDLLRRIGLPQRS